MKNVENIYEMNAKNEKRENQEYNFNLENHREENIHEISK